MMTQRLFALILVLVSACSLAPSTEVAQLPTATTIRVNPATLVPTVNRQLNVVPAVTAEVTETTVVFGDCQLTAGLPTAHYTVSANINYEQRAMMVRQKAAFINRSNDSLSEIVFVVESNQWPESFLLNEVLVENQVAGYELTGRRLTVDLPQTLEPGCGLDIALAFQLDVPQIAGGLTAYKGFFGYSERQINLGNWLPVVAPHMGDEWIVRDAVLVGEQTVYEVADWDVTVNVSNGPDTLVIAGPGIVEQSGDRSWQFLVDDARDFTLSLSDQFVVSRAQTESGVGVELYSFEDALFTDAQGQLVNGAVHALDTATKSLAMYEDLYGPYPYNRLAVVEGDFPDGMEFTGLVFVSRDWFTRYTGDPASFLTIITVHEVAHQWWYAAVGNDQAMTPWLDEALATYSEFVFIEEYYPDLKDWWWKWRVDDYAPQGFVDSNVYQFSSIREYINTVYLLGARMLHELRDELGTEAFFALLRRYHEAGAGRIAGSDVFWAALSPDELTATRATRQRYFRLGGPGTE